MNDYVTLDPFGAWASRDHVYFGTHNEPAIGSLK